MGDAIRPSAARAGVTFEVERLEHEDGELVVSGHWSGLRGVRFVRPTLVVGDRHVLATLEHKPWAPRNDRPWIAAFPWKGSPPDAAELELAVAPSVSVALGPPSEDPEPPLALVPDVAPAAETAPPPAEPAPVPDPAPPAPAPQPPEPPRVAPPRAVSAPVPDDYGTATNDRLRLRVAERELEDALAEREALRRELEETRRELAETQKRAEATIVERDELAAGLRRERRSADAAGESRDELLRARAAAERDRDLAQAQRDEAIADREAAVRTRTRMELAREEAIAARAAADAALERAIAERDEAHAQRDEVLLAYRGLQRHVQSERAGLDRAEHGDAAADADPDEPLGVRRMPAARTIMAELQRPPPSSKFVVSKFDVWVVRVLGSVAAGCFILLLIAIIRVFI